MENNSTFRRLTDSDKCFKVWSQLCNEMLLAKLNNNPLPEDFVRIITFAKYHIDSTHTKGWNIQHIDEELDRNPREGLTYLVDSTSEYVSHKPGPKGYEGYFARVTAAERNVKGFERKISFKKFIHWYLKTKRGFITLAEYRKNRVGEYWENQHKFDEFVNLYQRCISENWNKTGCKAHLGDTKFEILMMYKDYGFENPLRSERKPHKPHTPKNMMEKVNAIKEKIVKGIRLTQVEKNFKCRHKDLFNYEDECIRC